MGAKSAVSPQPGAGKSYPAIEVSDLSFSYGERRALSNLNFIIARGELFGFLGPNGGGKTTLFRLLSTLVPLQGGSARILGQELRGATIALRRRMGIVFQHPALDPRLTVAENLAHHGRLYGICGRSLRERAAAMLERFGLGPRSDDLVDTLSGGLKRRVELAKALLHEPELLVLDEPSTGLDPTARREFFDHLARLREQRSVTVVLTTHYLEEADRCDRIGVLHQGKLLAVAPPSELKHRVGGDVVLIHAPAPHLLQKKLVERFKLSAAIVDGAIRIERPGGHELVRDVVEAFGDEIEQVSFGRPTLNDVFVHLTGERFVSGPLSGAVQ